MFKQREAIIRLLKDSDPETVDLTKRQLARGGSATIPDLRDLLSTDDERVTQHVREILTEIESQCAKEAFDNRCGRITDLPISNKPAGTWLKSFSPGSRLNLTGTQSTHGVENCACAFRRVVRICREPLRWVITSERNSVCGETKRTITTPGTLCSLA